jgi:hypothetical protein
VDNPPNSNDNQNLSVYNYYCSCISRKLINRSKFLKNCRPLPTSRVSCPWQK